MAKRNGIILKEDLLPVFSRLDGALLGKLIVAALHYEQTGEEPDFSYDDMAEIVWLMLKSRINEDRKIYSEKVEIMANARKHRQPSRKAREAAIIAQQSVGFEHGK